MPKRISQPPVDREVRPSERRSYGPGLVLVLLGAFLLVIGNGRVTRVETTGGGLAREIEINRAMANGGVVLVKATAMASEPPGFDVPPWVQLRGPPPPPRKMAKPVTPGLKIDVRAKAACPT